MNWGDRGSVGSGDCYGKKLRHEIVGIGKQFHSLVETFYQINYKP